MRKTAHIGRHLGWVAVTRVTAVLIVVIVAAGGAFDAPPTGHADADTGMAARVSDLLSRVAVVDEIPEIPGYQRGCGKSQGCVFGPAWSDPTDHSGCDTRNRLLGRSLQGVEFKAGTRDCKVIAGRLDPDPYTGKVVDLRQVALDHVVPLKVAWNSGAAYWDLQQRRVFANDIDELIAVSSAANSSKGDSTPAEWLPQIGQCAYVAGYLAVAVKYGLPVTVKDAAVSQQACR